MNAKDWNVVKDKLENLYDSVELNCDGYKLTLVLARTGQFTNGIQVFVNGEFNGKWFIEDCEERRRFFRASKRSFLTAKDRVALKKGRVGKKRIEEIDEESKYIVYDPIWKSFNSLKKHLIESNKKISLIKNKGGI